MRILWTLTAWKDYVEWQDTDPTAVIKINSFIEDIRRDPAGKGIGKAERLKGQLSGWSARRITHEHRLVYRVQGADAGQTIEIIHCRGHYA
jgi:toxin YoeB